MPKKTRRQKVAATLRKQPITHQISLTPPLVTPQTKPTPQVMTQSLPKTKDSQEETQMVTYFKKDLKRSLIFITCIIGLEISLYFASINHYFSLGR